MSNTVVCIDIEGKKHEVPVQQLRWRPSVYAIIIKDNKLLVSPQFHGYDLPGGGIELGELPEAALLREIKEETGIIASNPRLLTCQTSFFKLPVSAKGVFVQSLLMYYVCDSAGGELSDSGFTEDEKLYSRHPEWLPIKNSDIQLSRGRICSSFDWRPLVRQVADGNR